MINYAQYEQAILGMLFSKPNLILTENIEDRWFITYRSIVTAMKKLTANDVAIDFLSLAEVLDKDDLHLLGVLNNNPYMNVPTDNYKKYLKLLQDQYVLNIIRSSLQNGIDEIDAGNGSVQVLSNMLLEVMQSTNVEEKKYTYTAKEGMREFIDKLSETYDALDAGGVGLKTGIKRLDDIMGGLHPSDMVIVGARPGAGKTAFSLSIMSKLMLERKRVGFFSTEMSVVQVMARLASLESRINAKKIRDADLDCEDFARITAIHNRIVEYDLRICDKPAITVGELSMMARIWMTNGGLDFIVVDYLTRLHPDKKSTNQNLDVGQIVTSLKDLARNLNIPVMVLAQLNRQMSNRKDKRPIMSDLRDSGIIEQEADQILMLYRPEAQEGSKIVPPSEIIVEKNRHGECGIAQVAFKPEIMEWCDLDSGSDDDDNEF